MAETYPCMTIYEMAAIPLEARGRFLAELPVMLGMIDAYNAYNPTLKPTIINWEDDHAGELRVKVVAGGETVAQHTFQMGAEHG